MRLELRNFSKGIVIKSHLQHVAAIRQSSSPLTQVKTPCLLFGTPYGVPLNEHTSLLMTTELSVLIFLLIQTTLLLFLTTFLKQSLYGTLMMRIEMNLLSLQHSLIMRTNYSMMFDLTLQMLMK